MVETRSGYNTDPNERYSNYLQEWQEEINIQKQYRKDVIRNFELHAEHTRRIATLRQEVRRQNEH